jgi:CDP-glycerol glycerophosphotransferase
MDTFSKNYLRNRAIEARQWSYLLSPNPFCSSVFPGAFGYDGPMLEVGSPRNDRLVDGPLPAEVAGIRRHLGVSDHARVVLYAPTWREGQLARNSFALDLGSAARSVGDDVVILLRGHSNVSGSSTMFDDPNVVNVSDYPDITDLYLASDALVTDYSSVMFDFACLQRPMAFHCPDLARYRDEVRGWYFDFVERAPGPMSLRSEDFPETIAAVLEGGPGIVASDRFQSFHNTFCATERGSASREVAATVVADLSHLR